MRRCTTAAAALLLGALVHPLNGQTPPPNPCPPDNPCAGGQPALAPLSCCTIDGSVRPWFTLRADVGDGVGFRNGFTSGEAFLPVWQCPGEFVVFGNLRGINYEDARYWESQVGGGVRYVLSDRVILGVNGFYDGRNASSRYFNQLGTGWELLGKVWETRGNVYLPVGTQRFLVSDLGFTNPQFVRTNISLDHLRVFDVAMRGVDAEVGRGICLSDWVEPKFYLGGYRYTNDDARTANGVRGRMEVRLGERLTAHLQVQYDPVFKTTVYGGVGISFGKPSRCSCCEAPLEDKLAERVVRDPNVVIQRSTTNTKELALDPATGRPIEVRHVDSGAGPGGDGSVEHPFQTLAQLQGGSAPGQILFAHANSVFAGQAIALQTGQRFLGEGIDHLFTAVQGTFLLPRATSGTALPVILNAPTDAVTLASSTEVSGFRILNPNGAGIAGQNIASVNINRNFIQNALGDGIGLDNLSGQSLIVSNTIDTVTFRGINPLVGFEAAVGIRVFETGATQGTLTIVGNTVSNIVASSAAGQAGGIVVQTFGSSVIRGVINRNSVTNVSGGAVGIGIDLESHDNSTAVFQIGNNTTLSTSVAGIVVNSLDSSFLGLQLIGNNVAGSPVPIQLAQFDPTATFQAEDTLGTNSPAPTIFGVTIVPVGTFGFGPP
jgi:hypothetical protein